MLPTGPRTVEQIINGLWGNHKAGSAIAGIAGSGGKNRKAEAAKAEDRSQPEERSRGEGGNGEQAVAGVGKWSRLHCEDRQASGSQSWAGRLQSAFTVVCHVAGVHPELFARQPASRDSWNLRHEAISKHPAL